MTKIFPNYEVTSVYSYPNLAFHRIAFEKGYTVVRTLKYNGTDEIDLEGATCSLVDADGSVYGLFETTNGVVLVYTYTGQTHLYAAASTEEDVEEAIELGRAHSPEEVSVDDNTVSITFWAMGAQGPVSRRRRIAVPNWSEIEANYNTSSYLNLSELMDAEFRPTKGGQLILWHGPPGTGKTTALRALGNTWKDWADFHFITDPERFFGNEADYMMNVMIDQADNERWRVLILEDCGELLAKDARAQLANPQALSRFLNAVDGILGQGLKFIVLVTTNEELGKLHSAVTRPGRCLNQTEFLELEPEKVREFSELHNIEMLPRRASLAELFALKENYSNKQIVSKATYGFGTS